MGNSLFPLTSDDRRTTLIGHSIVNGIGVLALAAMHIWGKLDAGAAAAIIGVICGLWGINTRKGPPTAPPGASGLLLLLLAPLFGRSPWA